MQDTGSHTSTSCVTSGAPLLGEKTAEGEVDSGQTLGRPS